VRRRLGTIVVLLIGCTVLGLLSYSFVVSVGLPAEQRVAPLATIATGIALLAVATLAYLLQRRSFDALHEPSLGIIWKDPAMLPSRETATAEPRDIYAEYVMWNAGDVPILVQQPLPALPPGPGPADPSRERVELERVRGSEVVLEKSFPIVLGRGEVCIWRQFTGDLAHLRPQLSGRHDVDREKVVRWLERTEGDRKFLFEVTYLSKPPALLKRRDLHKQYVGFSYRASDCVANGQDRRS